MKKNIVYLFLFPLVCSCLHSTPDKQCPVRYGVEHNHVRDSLGIVLLDSSWVAIQTWDGVTIWGPKVEQIAPRHTFKQVNYHNNELYFESDMYGNGETYNTIDRNFNVSLEVFYFYRSAASGPLAGITYNTDTVGWYCIYEHGTYDRVSKVQADSIIKAWGIKN